MVGDNPQGNRAGVGFQLGDSVSLQDVIGAVQELSGIQDLVPEPEPEPEPIPQQEQLADGPINPELFEESLSDTDDETDEELDSNAPIVALTVVISFAVPITKSDETGSIQLCARSSTRQYSCTTILVFRGTCGTWTEKMPGDTIF